MTTSEALWLEQLDTPALRRTYAPRVWDMIAKTYERYGNSEDGNLYGAEIENLIETPGQWRLLLRGEQIVAGVIYRSFRGSKVRLVFHDDTHEGKADFKLLFVGPFLAGRCWGEFSGNLERILRERGVQPIPNTRAAAILGKEIFSLDPDGLHYEREVYPGTTKREMLFGFAEE